MPSISSESLTEGGAGDEDEEAALEGAPSHRHRERGDWGDCRRRCLEVLRSLSQFDASEAR